jgi:hypothetical protein
MRCHFVVDAFPPLSLAGWIGGHASGTLKPESAQ